MSSRPLPSIALACFAAILSVTVAAPALGQARDVVTAEGTVAAPDPPIGVSAHVSGSRVDLSWVRASTGGVATGYVVEAAVTPNGPSIASLPAAAPMLRVTAVPNGTYFVRVRARNADGVSGPSAEISVSVGSVACAAPPPGPSGLAARVSGRLVTLTWQAGSGCAPTGYEVRAGSSPGLTNVARLAIGATGSSFQVNAPPGSYFVTVVARNAFGTSHPSNEVRVDVGAACLLPGPPVAFSGSQTAGTASFSWQPPLSGSATDYLLEVGTSPGAADTAIVPVASTSYGMESPGAGTYYSRVRARNACGVGAPSPEQTIVIGAACSAPGQAATPVAVVTGSTASIRWTALDRATSYRLDVGTVSGGSNILSETSPATERQLVGLSPGTYFARVTAANACGSGRRSTDVQFGVAPSCLPPFAPPPPMISASGSSASLGWLPMLGVTGYRVEIGRAPGASDIAAQTVTAPNYRQGQLAAGRYYARIRALNSCGASAASSEQTFVIAAPPTTVTLRPQYDNLVMVNSYFPDTANRSYPADELAVGCNWSFVQRWEYVCAASLLRFDVSALANQTISRAVLRLNVLHTPGPEMRRWRVTAVDRYWGPNVTWNAVVNARDYPELRIDNLAPPCCPGDVVTVDVTAIVRAWANGTRANHGFSLETMDPNGDTLYAFSFYPLEAGQAGPTVTVTYQ